jgi:hypothetical protein
MKSIAFSILASSIVVVDAWLTLNNKNDFGGFYLCIFATCLIAMFAS